MLNCIAFLFLIIYINMDNEIKERLWEIEVENVFLVIFIFIIILSYIANVFEKSYFINGSDEDKDKYRNIQIFIFLVVVLINLYYVCNSYKDVVNLLDNENARKKEYAYLSFIASLAALVASSIILYIAITDKNIDAEISL